MRPESSHLAPASMRPRHSRRGDGACHYANSRRALADDFRALRDEGSGFMTRSEGIRVTEGCKLFSRDSALRALRGFGGHATARLGKAAILHDHRAAIDQRKRLPEAFFDAGSFPQRDRENHSSRYTVIFKVPALIDHSR